MDRGRQVAMYGRKRFYVEEVTGGWLFVHTRTGSERFEEVGVR